MVRAGEVAGNLDEVLERLADFLDGAQKLKARSRRRWSTRSS
ncbi:MAG: type II secretion system F family protein [Kofleriaceae bacterium]